jgi:hypothetical protein
VYLASGSEFATGRHKRAVNLIQCCPLSQHPALFFSLAHFPGCLPLPVSTSCVQSEMLRSSDPPGVNTKHREIRSTPSSNGRVRYEALAEVTGIRHHVAG